MAPKNLKVVTFTGADDSIKAGELLAVAKDHPNTEWGILFSGPHGSGSSRFPSYQWITEQVPQLEGLNLCAHLCGSVMFNLAVRGNFDWFEHFGHVAKYFKRFQLNFHGQRFCSHIHKNFYSALENVADDYNFIFQADGVNDHLIEHFSNNEDDELKDAAAPLFDVSHGAGSLPRGGWPWRNATLYAGYAGGLGPENIVDQLKAIDEAAGDYGPYWIDMETRVRSNGDKLFDLGKCRRVMELIG